MVAHASGLRFKISRKRDASATLDKLAFRRRGRFRHVKPEIRKKIGARNQPKKFVVVHHDSHSASIEYAQQVCDFGVRRQCFQLVRHRLAYGIVKMRRLAVHFYQEIGFVETLPPDAKRSEEHTSELQSRQYLVCRL